MHLNMNNKYLLIIIVYKKLVGMHFLISLGKMYLKFKLMNILI